MSNTSNSSCNLKSGMPLMSQSSMHASPSSYQYSTDGGNPHQSLDPNLGEPSQISIYNSMRQPAYGQQQRLSAGSVEKSPQLSERIPPQTPRPSAPPPQERRSLLREDSNVSADYGMRQPQPPQVYAAYPSASPQSHPPRGSKTAQQIHGPPTPSQPGYVHHQQQQQQSVHPQQSPQNSQQMIHPQQPYYGKEEQSPYAYSSQSSELIHQLPPQSPIVSIQQSISSQNTAFQIQQRSSSMSGGQNSKLQKIQQQQQAMHHHRSVDDTSMGGLPPPPHPNLHPPPSPQVVNVQHLPTHAYVSPSPQSQPSSASVVYGAPASNNSSASGGVGDNFQQPPTPDNSHRSFHMVKESGADISHSQLQGMQGYPSATQDYLHQRRIQSAQHSQMAGGPPTQQVAYRSQHQPMAHHQLHSSHLSSSLVDDNGAAYCAENEDGIVSDDGAMMITSNQQHVQYSQQKRQISHQSQQHFTVGPAAIPIHSAPPQPPSGISHIPLQPNSAQILGGTVPPRIYVHQQQQPQHSQQPHGVHSTAHQQQQPHPQQQHLMAMNGSKPSIQQPQQQQILINSGAPMPVQQLQQQSQVMPPTRQQLIYAHHQQQQQLMPGGSNAGALNVPQQQQQQAPLVYVGSQRFYANSVAGQQPGGLSSAPSLVSRSAIATGPTEGTANGNPKFMYRDLKRKFKYLVYENEYYQEELRNLQRKLLKLSRDKNFLLDRLQGYEVLSDSSDDSDASAKTVEERPQKIRRRAPTANRSATGTTGRKRGAAVNGTGAPATSSSAGNKRGGGAGNRSNAQPPAPTESKVENIYGGNNMDTGMTSNANYYQSVPSNQLQQQHNYQQQNHGQYVNHQYQQPQSGYHQTSQVVENGHHTSQQISQTPSRTSSTSPANFNAGDFLAPKSASFSMPYNSSSAINNTGNFTGPPPPPPQHKSSVGSYTTTGSGNINTVAHGRRLSQQQNSQPRRRNPGNASQPASVGSSHSSLPPLNNSESAVGNQGQGYPTLPSTAPPSVSTATAESSEEAAAGQKPTIFVSCAAPSSSSSAPTFGADNIGSSHNMTAADTAKNIRRSSSDANFPDFIKREAASFPTTSSTASSKLNQDSEELHKLQQLKSSTTTGQYSASASIGGGGWMSNEGHKMDTGEVGSFPHDSNNAPKEAKYKSGGSEENLQS